MRKYWPLPPKGHHRSFRIMSKENESLSQVKDARLDSVNKLFKDKVLDLETATRQVNDIVKDLREKEKPDKDIYLESNMDIFERYFKEEYEGRDILPDSLKTARASFKRAIALLGKHELTTVSEKEVQKLIFSKPYRKRMHLVLALNALFKYINRKHTFDIGKNTGMERVRYLSVKDFLQVLPNISNPLVKIMAATDFATGCRVGELFSLTHYNELNRQITIFTQIDRKKTERPPKTNVRTAVVIKELESYVKEWIATPIETRLTIRNAHHANYLKEACKKTFPDRKEKHCHFYDLRHSYAIHFLSMGVSLSLVAQALGNSEKVCKKHYTGFILSDEGTALMNKLQERAG